MITSKGLAPYLDTTTPPTTSAPSLSKMPRLVFGASETLAMSFILIEVKSSDTTTAFSMSEIDLI